MRLGTHGILVNQFGQILLIQRNDTRTFAIPGGGLERGELPTDNIAREIREETGIIALPVRLVSATFWALKPKGVLAFNFRCMQRGGDIQTSLESPRVGFYNTSPLPRPMLSLSREQIEQGLRHAGGAVEWWTIRHTAAMRLGRIFIFKILYPLLDWKRKIQGLPLFQEPPDWEITVRVVAQNEAGEVLWQETAAGWQLPGGVVPAMTPPWETAAASVAFTPRLTDLRGVYVVEGSSRMTLVFTAVTNSTHTPSPQTCWLPPTQTPSNHHQQHPQFIRHALAPDTLTSFQLLNDTGG